MTKKQTSFADSNEDQCLLFTSGEMALDHGLAPDVLSRFLPHAFERQALLASC
jgi:hypothetical protein